MNNPRNNDIRELLYWIGMESDTAAQNMHKLCELCGVSYPPGLYNIPAHSTAPSAPASQPEAAHA